jgi:EAL domain-containing protein (putative c-di-GMP-specific phosphodiesterase class I)
MQARRILELDLRQALRNEEFDLFFQPLIDMKMKRPVGCEALLRWRHPTKGLVPPDQFIALAEETGLIVPIGAWVLRRACTAAAEWPGRLKVAVNLSPVQFKKRGLVDLIATSLQESGLEPERLEIEITESVMLQDTPATLAILRQLQKMGIKIAMDDFGTGYSSLSYLRQFPFDRIKIDQSFVRGLGSSQDCAAIVYAVSALGSNLGMAITAEGVETWAQLNALENTGCSEVQGYLFSPAVSQGELIALLQRTPSGFETDPALMPSAPVCAPAT